MKQITKIVYDNQQWTVLIAFSLLSFTNAMGYVNLLSVVQTASQYYHITQTSLLQLDNISFATYILLGWAAYPILNWRIDYSMIASAFLTTTSYWIRYAAQRQFIMAQIGSFLGSLGQIIILPGYIYIAQKWFPLNIRALVTGIPFYFNMAGLNFAFLFSAYYINQDPNNVPPAQLIYALISTFIFIIVCIFIKNQPRSFYSKKKNYKEKLTAIESLKQLCKDPFKIYNIIVLSFFLGLSWCMMNIIGYIFGQDITHNQIFTIQEIGILGLSFNLGGILGGCILSVLSLNECNKKQTPRYDLYTKVTLSIGLASILALGLLISFSINYLVCYITIIFILGFGLNSYFSVSLQSLVQLLFPINELVISIIFFYGSSIFSYVGTLATTLPIISKYNMYMLGTIMALPLLYVCICYHTVFKRKQQEMEWNIQDEFNQSSNEEQKRK